MRHAAVGVARADADDRRAGNFIGILDIDCAKRDVAEGDVLHQRAIQRTGVIARIRRQHTGIDIAHRAAIDRGGRAQAAGPVVEHVTNADSRVGQCAGVDVITVDHDGLGILHRLDLHAVPLPRLRDVDRSDQGIAGKSIGAGRAVEQVMKNRRAGSMDFIAQHGWHLQTGISCIVISGLNAHAHLIHQVVADLRVEVIASIDADAPGRGVADIAETTELDKIVATWRIRIASGVVGQYARPADVANHHILYGDITAECKNSRIHIRIGTVQIDRASHRWREQIVVVAVNSQSIQRYPRTIDLHDRAFPKRVERQAGIDHCRHEDGLAGIAATADIARACIAAGLRAFDRNGFVDDQVFAGSAVLGIRACGNVDRVVGIRLSDRIGDGFAWRCQHIARAAVGAAGGDITIKIKTGFDTAASGGDDTEVIDVHAVRAIRDRVGSIRLLRTGIGIAGDAKAGIVARHYGACGVAITTVEKRGLPRTDIAAVEHDIAAAIENLVVNLVVADMAYRGCRTQGWIRGDGARAIHEGRVDVRAVPHAA